MLYQELFNLGGSYSDYVNQGSDEEIQALAKIDQQLLSLTPTLKQRISELNMDVHLLVAGDMWCPDCRLNIAALNHITKLQAKVKMSIMPKVLAEDKMLALLDMKEIKIPAVAILSDDFQLRSLFIERPMVVANHNNFDEIKDSYFAGHYLNDTISEILDKLCSETH